MKPVITLSLLFSALLCFSQEEGEWDSYLADYEGKIGSTLLDMSLIRVAPLKNLPFVLVTGVTFKDCNEDGMPSAAEFQNLYQISDSVKKIVEKAVSSRLAGTFTHKCQRFDYYYIADTTNLRRQLTELYQQKFPLYEPYIGLKEDRNWKYYLDFLFPNIAVQEYMKNIKVITKLSEAGDKLDKPRQLDHWIYFESEANRVRFIQYARKEKFKVERTDKLKDRERPYLLQISRIDRVDMPSISQITAELRKQAELYKGKYDGWETFVIKE